MREWEERLKRSKFPDIEFTNRKGDRELVNSASNAYRGANDIERQARLEFFLECSSHCARTKFRRRIDKLIMERFSDGKQNVEIKKDLDRMGTRRDIHTIGQTIRKFLILWGLYRSK